MSMQLFFLLDTHVNVCTSMHLCLCLHVNLTLFFFFFLKRKPLDSLQLKLCHHEMKDQAIGGEILIIVVKLYDLKEGGAFSGLAKISNDLEKLEFLCKKDSTGLLLLNARQIQIQVEYTLRVFESTLIHNKTVVKIVKLPFLFLCKNCMKPAEALLLFKKLFHKEMCQNQISGSTSVITYIRKYVTIKIPLGLFLTPYYGLLKLKHHSK